MEDWEPYEGSVRQRRSQRRRRAVAVIILLALVLPLLISAITAITG